MTRGDWPREINTVEELDEVLSRPSDALIDYMGRLDGDLMILGAGGKVGPTMVETARRAIEAAGVKKRITAVDVMPMEGRVHPSVKTITCDLLDLEAVSGLPEVQNIVFMVGRKFGSTGAEHLTWAINVTVPYLTARRFVNSRIAAFSTGCVYPVMHVSTGGATEETPTGAVGEYAQSCVGRERMFDHFSETAGEKVVHIRLNYAVELRYGVLFDVGWNVWNGRPVDITTGYANVIWQGDVCEQVLRCFDLAGSPPRILNLTGKEMLKIRDVAARFGELLGKEVVLVGQENGMGYLSNPAQAVSLFGEPDVAPDQVIQWIAHWLKIGGQTLGKPTHFETQDGKY